MSADFASNGRTGAATTGTATTGTMVPTRYRVRERIVEAADCASLTLEPVDRALAPFRPGQFMMLYAFGIGEIAVSCSGDPGAAGGAAMHTIRGVGAVSTALRDATPGTVIGMRGPFGTDWNLADCAERDLLIVAGGVGLAAVRAAVVAAVGRRDRYRRIVLVVGARTPAQILYGRELDMWATDFGVEVELTIDRPAVGWTGSVGFVTDPLRRLALDADATSALLCGPEPMMRFAARVLLEKGIRPDDVRVSLERNMQCGIGHCGHCQLGELLLCRDGPVVPYSVARPLLGVGEL
ncbi:FAD/NAD(P)-binding protein [Gordonia rhizosphera]|uniref:Putative NiFe-hydrogenase gamma subunit n=1 Tax=Gordonia rhizosphera NBRC 16068 TaxID=1108045 RepID=K6VQH4_9ACTN|nr:putative NiFe-hydrogenase gamma subunit [Gordonia rhizosphera NBRC 16068]